MVLIMVYLPITREYSPTCLALRKLPKKLAQNLRSRFLRNWHILPHLRVLKVNVTRGFSIVNQLTVFANSIQHIIESIGLIKVGHQDFLLILGI